MAYSRKAATKKSGNKWQEVTDMPGFSVIGDRDRFSISFEVCEGCRISINGCRVYTSANGDFISYPAWKGNDGKYHDYAHITFSKEEQEMIISML